VIGDRGYDSNEFRKELEGKTTPRSYRYGRTGKEALAYDKEIYKKRRLIERIFEKLKKNRRLTVRYEKSDLTFLGFIITAFLINPRLLTPPSVHTH
jgi:transposase